MFRTRLVSTSSCAVALGLTLACVPAAQPTVGTAPGAQTTSQTQQKQTKDNSADTTPATVADPSANAPASTLPAVETPPGVTLPPEQTVQQRYPNWVDPPQSEFDNPKRAKIYNYTNDGIATVNGQTLPQVVPPGKVALVPKRSTDIDENTGMYRVSVTTDTGKSGSGQFNPDNVNMGNWRASVSDNGGVLTIQENAGGGGGDAGGGGEDNFEF
jgi:hypothetical protein